MRKSNLALGSSACAKTKTPPFIGIAFYLKFRTWEKYLFVCLPPHSRRFGRLIFVLGVQQRCPCSMFYTKELEMLSQSRLQLQLLVVRVADRSEAHATPKTCPKTVTPLSYQRNRTRQRGIIEGESYTVRRGQGGRDAEEKQTFSRDKTGQRTELGRRRTKTTTDRLNGRVATWNDRTHQRLRGKGCLGQEVGFDDSASPSLPVTAKKGQRNARFLEAPGRRRECAMRYGPAHHANSW